MGEELKALTEQLHEYNEQLLVIARRARERNQEPDFFAEVKPFAEEVQAAAERWKEAASRWIRQTQPKYVHERQIEATVDHMTKLSVEAFYPSVPNRRIKQYSQAVAYTLDLVKERLGETS
ncbi:YppE family protein [Geobacillus thermodenitrificans]|uniref:YppE family protein n=1 Tax=Geobacillus thermodenitrificans TaxID=33940 RepID=UPI0034C6A3BD